MKNDTITLYEAIKQMRRFSQIGRPFSFVHATYNYSTKKTSGIRRVSRAKLRPAASGDNVVNADYKLFYYDETIDENRVCWQMLILYFNDQRVVLN